MSPRDRQAKLEEMLSHRWVRLHRLAEVTDFSPRTLRRWAEEGRLPASRRFGCRLWWIDVRAFLALRRDGSEDLLSA